MAAPVQVTIHPSQFPDAVRRDLLESLRTRRVNHKFHYDSIKQTQQWLALHQAYSPSRTDLDCAATYDRSFAAVVSRMEYRRVHLIGLGCGGGQKDTRLLKLLCDAGREVFYTPSDVSTAMVLVAQQAATSVIASGNCFPLVCDLATADDLPAVLEALPVPNAARLITFFGMIPNFEPQLILLRLASLVRLGDCLLFSANLAPGPDYAAGVQRILPLYDNALTREWLMTFLLDLGIEANDGTLTFVIEDEASGRDLTPVVPEPGRESTGTPLPALSPPGGERVAAGRERGSSLSSSASRLKRVAAYFNFSRARELTIDDQRVAFAAGTSLRLFFSYRHTPELVKSLLGQHGLIVQEQWISASGEEGVFLVSRG